MFHFSSPAQDGKPDHEEFARTFKKLPVEVAFDPKFHRGHGAAARRSLSKNFLSTADLNARGLFSPLSSSSKHTHDTHGTLGTIGTHASRKSLAGGPAISSISNPSLAGFQSTANSRNRFMNDVFSSNIYLGYSSQRSHQQPQYLLGSKPIADPYESTQKRHSMEREPMQGGDAHRQSYQTLSPSYSKTMKTTKQIEQELALQEFPQHSRP